MWQRTKSVSKQGFDKAWGWADKLGTPVNNLSNKLGSEAFWPTTMDKECDKAARILRSFCKDGFQAVEEEPADGLRPDGVPRKNHTKVIKRIPASVVKNAKGIAIFTTMRTGLWVSGAGGSGVLMARLPDGNWSCPSGILLHTAGVGFLVGVDIYDCVMVLNTDEAVNAFSKIRCTVGGELSAVAGPLGVGGVLDSEVHARRAPIFTYLKSRGFYAGVQLDGTIIIERTDENERFYGRRIPVGDILAGRVSHVPRDTQKLLQTVKMAQGDTDVDVSMLSVEAPPSDFDMGTGQVFGVPDREDPDPYGVLALEQEGLVIREAGTQQEATHEQFQFMPSPTSPLFGAFKSGQSWGKVGNGPDSARSSWRTSNTDRSLSSPKFSSTTLIDSPPSTSRPDSGNYANKMAGIPETDSIDQKLTDSEELSMRNSSETMDDKKTSFESLDASKTPTIGSNGATRKRTPPPLPPRQLGTAASRILKEQLALAGQLRELISPTGSENNTSTPNTPIITSFNKNEKAITPPPRVVTDERSSAEISSANTSKDMDILPQLEIPVVVENSGDKLTAKDASPLLNSTVAVEDISEPLIIEDVTPDHTAASEAKSSTPLAIDESADDADKKAVDELDITEQAIETAIDADDEESVWSSDDEDVVFHEVVTTALPTRTATTSPQLVSRARVVNVTMPKTPALPSRNPERARRATLERLSSQDAASIDSQLETPLEGMATPDEYKPRSRASSVYSAKEETLSSTKGSDSLASVSSADNADGLGLSTGDFKSEPTISHAKQAL